VEVELSQLDASRRVQEDWDEEEEEEEEERSQLDSRYRVQEGGDEADQPVKPDVNLRETKDIDPVMEAGTAAPNSHLIALPGPLEPLLSLSSEASKSSVVFRSSSSIYSPT
jgi:hypothetical protein